MLYFVFGKNKFQLPLYLCIYHFIIIEPQTKKPKSHHKYPNFHYHVEYTYNYRNSNIQPLKYGYDECYFFTKHSLHILLNEPFLMQVHDPTPIHNNI